MSPAVERKLAAILSADVVGYSRLMAEDEQGTIRTLATYREEIGVLVRHHRGRVADFTGDNFLAEFPTALEAVEAAIEIQRVIHARNTDLAPERRMEFRVGIHLGDVTVEGERVYGDGVNIAARLEGLADPGGICVSATVHEQVRHKLELAYEDLGEQEVKNIPDPVRVLRVQMESASAAVSSDRRPQRLIPVAATALALVALAAIAFWALREDRILGGVIVASTDGAESEAVDERYTVPGFGGAPAIAVLPFDNLSGDPEQEYFADGIAEDLITRLSRFRQFPVIARNSSFVYKGRAVDVKQVSRELGVRYVLEGSVRRAGSRVRISAQLIDAATGVHLWAETYDRDLRHIFELQDEITGTVVASMNPALLQSESKRAMRKQPHKLDAYDHYMRGMWHSSKSPPREEENREARALFRTAIALDPEFAAPLASLAWTHYVDNLFQWTDSPAQSLEQQLQAAERCAALDGTLADCQLALAWAHSISGQRRKAVAASERAIQLNPSWAEAQWVHGLFIGLGGRPDEGIAHIERAMRLSPQDPLMGIFQHCIAMTHFAAGRYEDAVTWEQQALELVPDYYVALATLAASQGHLGELDEAAATLRETLARSPEFSEDTMRRIASFAEPAFIESFLEGLRKAGWEG